MPYITEQNFASKWRIVKLTIPTSMTKLSEVIASATPNPPTNKPINQIDFLADATQSFTIYDNFNDTDGVPHANGDKYRIALVNADKQARVKAGTQGTVTAVLWY